MEELIIESPDVTLTTPVYNVTRIKLISGRIPNTQLLINEHNCTFVVGSTPYSIALGTYTSGSDLATAFNNTGSGASASYTELTNSLVFSGAAFEPNPWLASILGYHPSGPIDLTGTRYITLRLTIGKDTLSQKVYPDGTDCHYLGKILTGPVGNVIHYTDTLDTIEMKTQVKTIQSLHTDFLNPDGSLYTMTQPWILKFHLECSTDKMSLTSKDTVTENFLPPPLPWISEPDNQRFIMIAALVLLSFGLFLLMR